ncbi:aminoacylase-1 [Ramicandelaber brevisporus]|nr:aminoacylase-1 [Ramicandelaber brevisporus]
MTVSNNASAAPEPQSVANFRAYLQINTMQPTPDYAGCMTFLRAQAAELDLPFREYSCVPGKPLGIITWTGRDPSLPSLLLNSHTDVVPVFEDKWTHPPFSAARVPIHKDGGSGEVADHHIFARGSQDMKIVGTSYIEAIRVLKQRGYTPLRTIHMVFVPDEEIGGKDGMKAYVDTDDFKALNVGFALDEGIGNPGNAYKVFYGQRAVWWAKFTTTGKVGHGSQFIPDTAASKLHNIINELMAFREKQRVELESSNGKMLLGDVTTVNLNMLQSGVQPNVVPATATAVFDIRITPRQDYHEFEQYLKKLASDNDATLEFLDQNWGRTTVNCSSANPWWRVFQQISEETAIPLEAEIFPAATDSRFLLEAGVQCLGVSPLRFVPVLLHDHDEYISENGFLEGLKFYERLIEELGNVPAH